MIWTEKFIKTLITMTFTIIMLANMIYAFNLVGILPVDTGSSSGIDYSQYYFSFTNMLESFELFFGNNAYIQGFNDFLSSYRKVMDYLSLQRVFNVLSGLQFNASNGFSWTQIVDAVLGIANLLLNIPYIVFAIVYFLFYFVYFISLISIFITYFLALVGGRYKTPLPSIDYPTPWIPSPDLPYPWLS